MRSAVAQVKAGADALCLGDHCSGDMCSPAAYRRFLFPCHEELSRRVPCPIILHTCGETSDRIGMFAESTISCFHYDTRVQAARATALANGRISIMGGVSNVAALLAGDEARIAAEVQAALDAGVNIIGPECAIPLRTKMRSLACIREALMRCLD
jgi:[methyl-Co(III) methanol-specific corrinoid protein]:coenzyme M methyltransferase